MVIRGYVVEIMSSFSGYLPRAIFLQEPKGARTSTNYYLGLYGLLIGTKTPLENSHASRSRKVGLQILVYLEGQRDAVKKKMEATLLCRV